MKLIDINHHAVLLIEMYHPRHTSFHSVNRAHYPIYIAAIKQFLHEKFNIISFDQNISQEIKPVLKSENTAITHKPEQVLLKKSFQKDTDYIELDEYPEFPANKEPSKADCVGYTYMSMVQLCNLSKRLGKSRGFAYNAFGGDRGKYKVDPDRMTRAYLKGGY